jgi:hypothetical protein
METWAYNALATDVNDAPSLGLAGMDIFEIVLSIPEQSALEALSLHVLVLLSLLETSVLAERKSTLVDNGNRPIEAVEDGCVAVSTMFLIPEGMELGSVFLLLMFWVKRLFTFAIIVVICTNMSFASFSV